MAVFENYKEICAYTALAIGAFGLIGNALCAKVMRMGYLKGSSTCVLLFTCVLSDTIILVIELLDDIAELIPDISIGDMLYGHNDWRCRVSTFIYDTARVVSSWLTVALSVELCLVRGDPKRRPAIANTTRAIYVTLAIMLVASAACFPFLVIGKVDENNVCSSKYKLFFDTYSEIVLEIAVASLVPIFFIIVCTMKSVLSLLDSSDVSTPNSPEPNDPALSHLSDMGLTFSYAVIATCGVFLITVTPTAALETVNAIQKHYPGLNLPKTAVDLAFAVTKILFLFNHSAKLYVWFVTEEDFRSAWRQLYMCESISNITSAKPSMDIALSTGGTRRNKPPNYASTKEERL